jgi:hypothetical protein
MKYRKLPIAWSVVWSILCLLLIALWVRSYWWVEAIRFPEPGQRGVIQLLSIPGMFGIGEIRPATQESFYRMPAADWWTIVLADDSNSKLPSQAWGGWVHSKYVDQLLLPYWLLVLFLAALGCAPWLRWRFSLRTLLIGMTLIAALLGLAIWAAR